MEETWTTGEYGSSHEGSVGVLLADGTVPGPVYFDSASGSGGETVGHWSVYDGRWPHAPKAAVLRAVCSCGWTGPEHPVDWESIGETPFHEAGLTDADTCPQDWDGHTAAVGATTVPLPAEVIDLVERLVEEIEKLARTSPIAAVKAARQLEVAAARVGYWAAHDTRKDTPPDQAAAALGLSTADTRKLLARYGRWSPYR